MASLLAWLNFPIGDGAFYAVFGFLFVFTGIALLVGIFTLLGIVMKKVNGRAPKKRKIKDKDKQLKPVPMPVDEGISPEIVAVISAAIAAVYESENATCDFVVRRIKKI